MRGTESRWHGYLESLPRRVELPLLWDSTVDDQDDADSAMDWLVGTEVEKELYTVGEDGARILRLDAIKQFYTNIAESILRGTATQGSLEPNLKEFLHAFSLVSSRAFVVDAYHGLSMVPIADAFNHAQDNHVHIETDFDVCPSCGALYECPHDDNDHLPPIGRPRSDPNSSHHPDRDSCYEMVANAAIPPDSEIFNTYGEMLSNAQLLARYGFLLDANDNDCVTWTFDDLKAAWHSPVNHIAATLDRITQSPNSDVTFGKRCDESNLVYFNSTQDLHSNMFRINGDGKISHQLWLFFVCANGSPPSTVASLLDNQLRTEMGQDCETPFGSVLEDIARDVSSLCLIRRSSLRKLSELPTGADVGALLDELPENMARTKLAFTYLLTELSILECCSSVWNEFRDSLESADQ